MMLRPLKIVQHIVINITRVFLLLSVTNLSQEILGQYYQLDMRIIGSEMCLEHGRDNWTVGGELMMLDSETAFLEEFEPEVIVKATGDSDMEWIFQLNKCKVETQPAEDIGHYCYTTASLGGESYRFYIRQVADKLLSEQTLTAEMRCKDIGKCMKHTIGRLPQIIDSVGVTFELSYFTEESSLLKETKVPVTTYLSYKEATLKLCFENILTPFTVNIDGENATLKDKCVSRSIALETRSMNISYEESGCLHRREKFILKISYFNWKWILIVGLICGSAVAFVLCSALLFVCFKEMRKTNRAHKWACFEKEKESMRSDMTAKIASAKLKEMHDNLHEKSLQDPNKIQKIHKKRKSSGSEASGILLESTPLSPSSFESISRARPKIVNFFEKRRSTDRH